MAGEKDGQTGRVGPNPGKDPSPRIVPFPAKNGRTVTAPSTVGRGPTRHIRTLWKVTVLPLSVLSQSLLLPLLSNFAVISPIIQPELSLHPPSPAASLSEGGTVSGGHLKSSTAPPPINHPNHFGIPIDHFTPFSCHFPSKIALFGPLPLSCLFRRVICLPGFFPTDPKIDLSPSLIIC